MIENEMKQTKEILSRRKERQKEEILGRLRWIKDSVTKLEKDISEDFYGGLGSSLQNTWELFHNLGQLKALHESLELVDAE